MSARHSINGWGPYGRITCLCGERFEEPGAEEAIRAHIASDPDGMGVGRAIRLVAQHVLAKAARDENAIDWEDYPEIGENDWLRIVGRLDDIAPWPDMAEYEQAYEILRARAEKSA